MIVNLKIKHNHIDNLTYSNVHIKNVLKTRSLISVIDLNLL